MRLAGGALALFLLALIVVIGLRILKKRGAFFVYGNQKNPLYVSDNGRGLSVIDPLRMSSAVAGVDGNGGNIEMPISEAARLQIALAMAYVLGQQAQHNPFPPVKPIQLYQTDETKKFGAAEWTMSKTPITDALPSLAAHPSTPQLPSPAKAAAQAFIASSSVSLPDWSKFLNYDEPNLLIGMNEKYIALNPERDPHLMFAGTTGAGKTRQGLVITAASALRLGWHVIVLNRAGADFAALEKHPRLNLFDDQDVALNVLQALVAEVDRRNGILRERGVSTWRRLENAEPEILLLIDELVAFTLSLADQSLATQTWKHVVHTASAGRKCGLHFGFATTDPTHKTLGRLGLVVRDNCARVAFRLRGGQAVIPGGDALDLSQRHFLALTSDGNAPLAGAAFDPSDEQLQEFVALISRGIEREPFPLVIDQAPARDIEEEIRELHAKGKSINEIQRSVFGTGPGGRDYYRVKQAITTAQTSREMADAA